MSVLTKRIKNPSSSLRLGDFVPGQFFELEDTEDSNLYIVLCVTGPSDHVYCHNITTQCNTSFSSHRRVLRATPTRVEYVLV